MKLSKKWLSDYVEINGVTPREFSERMTMSGSKVEGYEIPHEKMKDIVIGKLLEFAPIQGDEKHFLCKTDVGEKILTQVTGAPNLEVGGYTAVAVPGSVLPNGKEIGETQFKGVKSEGMMCSLAELGLLLNDFPYAFENGIFFIKEPDVGDAQVGMNAATILGLDDIVTEFEITSNRPDCLSVIGLARETAATFDVPFKGHKPEVKGGGGDIGDYVKVTVKNPELCPRYVARAIKNIKIAPSPRFIRERLRASGMRAINNIVDITNYIMLEYGQPLHAFDLREIKSGEIIVRTAGEGDTHFTTLDGNERKISPEMLMICESKNPIGIAGVMGGLESEVKSDTTTVILEAATFAPVSIRRTSRKIGMRTEASGRYEKGLDSQMNLDAVNRACELIELCSAGEVVDGIIDIDHSGYVQTKVLLEVDRINALCGTELGRDEMEKILVSLGFEMAGDLVKVPTHRGDVTQMADLAEEVLRIYGYNKIGSTLFSGATAQGKYSPKQIFENRAGEAMLGFGFSEILTYTFVSPKVFDKLTLPEDAPERDYISIMNPLGEDTSAMRTTAIGSMLGALSLNYNNRNEKVCLFENAKIFLKSGEEMPNERFVLTMGAYGGADFYSLKGVVEALAESLGVKELEFETEKNNAVFHTGRCANIISDGKKIGVIGEIHPTVQNNFEIGSTTVLATLDMGYLRESMKAEILYTPLPRFPAVTRDIAVVCDRDLEVAKIARVIKAVCGELLEHSELFDVYMGEHVEAGKKSVAYSLILRDREATLKEEQITALMSKVVAELESKLSCVLRA